MMRQLIRAIKLDNPRKIDEFCRQNPQFSISQIDSQSGYMPLTLALKGKHMKAFEALLQNKADPNATDTLQVPLLVVLATEKFPPEIIKLGYELLLKHRAKTDYRHGDGATLLSLLSQEGYQEVIDVLLKVDPAQVNKQRQQGETALFLAAQYGHAATVRSLLNQHRADPNIVNQLQFSPLNVAASQAPEENVESLIESLVYAGADVNSANIDGATPLMYACERGLYNSIKFLLAKGADPPLSCLHRKIALFFLRFPMTIG